MSGATLEEKVQRLACRPRGADSKVSGHFRAGNPHHAPVPITEYDQGDAQLSSSSGAARPRLSSSLQRIRHLPTRPASVPARSHASSVRSALRVAANRRAPIVSSSGTRAAARSWTDGEPESPTRGFQAPGGACDATQGSWLVGAQARRDRVMAGPFALGAAPITSVAHSWQRCGQPAALQDTTHIAVEARNLSVSMAELVRADGVRGTAVAEVTGDAYGPQAPTVKPCRRLLRTRLRAQ